MAKTVIIKSSVPNATIANRKVQQDYKAFAEADRKKQLCVGKVGK
jgi:hypothetical protein